MKTFASALVLLAAAPALLAQNGQSTPQVVTGPAAFSGIGGEQPGTYRHIKVTDLPKPDPQEAVDNGPDIVPRPAGAMPVAPPGFTVELYAGGESGSSRAEQRRSTRPGQQQPAQRVAFRSPRLIRTAPNGDLFLSDSAAGTVYVLRGTDAQGKAQSIEPFATGLDHPFGIAFYPADNPRFVYVANTTSVVRFPYHSGDLHATGAAETVVQTLPGYAQLRGGGHWTRDVVFSADGQKMLVSVGSGSNADNPDTHPREFHRADVLAYNPDGKFLKVYAYGLRNCVGEAINPVTKQLWCSTNERDNLGNNLVPDYVTSVKEDGFYGWPWYYMGGHPDPRVPAPCVGGTGVDPQAGQTFDPGQAGACRHQDLSAKVITPDVLVQPHMASLEMAFYSAGQAPAAFPRQFEGDAFAAEHGSWNRANRTGYEVIRIPMHDGRAEGTYEDFLTGFWTADGQVWGRPVGVAVAKDGSLFVTDDGSRSVWHVRYTGRAGGTQTAANR